MAERQINQPDTKGNGARNPILQGLVGAGIDDLAKYRIVQYLRECDRAVDGCSIAASLGLHPLELVAEALESLASSGVLAKEEKDPPRYILSYNPSLRLALQRLYSPIPSQDRESIFRALAAASLARARARGRGNGG